MRFSRQNRWKGMGIEVLVTLVLCLVAAGYYMRSNPISLAPLPPETATAEPDTGRPNSNVLLIVPTSRRAGEPEEFVADQAWLNTVEQELGNFSVLTADRLTRGALDTASWVVVPRKAASQLDPTQIQFVQNYVEDGGFLFLEQPPGPWQHVIGQALRPAQHRPTRHITAFDGAVVRGKLREDLLQMPFHTTLAPFNPPNLDRGRDYAVLLEVDGQPGVVLLARGRGQILLVLFDYGRLVTELQQGRITDGFDIEGREAIDLPGEFTTTSSLVAEESLRTSTAPFVDLLERNLLYLADIHAPIARLWTFPGTHRGALLAVHSEARFGERSWFMIDWEHRHERRSTVYAVPQSVTPEGLARMARAGADVQLQWVPSGAPFAPVRTWGIKGFRPIRRPMGLPEQIVSLSGDLLPYPAPTVTRTLDGLWPDNYFHAFRQLDAAGIGLDQSYGPVSTELSGGREEAGYLFGTGLPFRPLDASGDRFDVWELPVVLNDSAAGYSLRRVRRMIVESSEGYHTVISADWRPDTMIRRPSFDALQGWREAFEVADSQELWITTAADYLDFLRRRQDSFVDSSFSREQRRMSIFAQLTGPTRGEQDATALTPSVAFPARFDGRPVVSIVADGRQVPLNELALSGDRVLQILPLAPGEHRLEVSYGTPMDLDVDRPEDER